MHKYYTNVYAYLQAKRSMCDYHVSFSLNIIHTHVCNCDRAHTHKHTYINVYLLLLVCMCVCVYVDNTTIIASTTCKNN